MLVSQGGGKMISTTFHYGINVSNFDKCHRNIIYGKINIPVPLSLSLSLSLQHMSERSWIIKKANIENIMKAISNFDWNKAFENLLVD